MRVWTYGFDLQTKKMEELPLTECVWTFFPGYHPCTTLTSSAVLHSIGTAQGARGIQTLLTVHGGRVGPPLVCLILYEDVSGRRFGI